MYAILGTNQLPDLRGRFLQGNDIGGTIIEPALPNITGQYFDDGFDRGPSLSSGSFYPVWTGMQRCSHSGVAYGGYILNFDASRSSSIYRNSCTTVQPPAVTVRYYIRAK